MTGSPVSQIAPTASAGGPPARTGRSPTRPPARSAPPQNRAPSRGAAFSADKRRTWSTLRHGNDPAEEIVEQESGVLRAGTRFRVELDAEVRMMPRADAFVAAVVDVHEPGLPVPAQGPVAHCIAGILAGHVAAPGQEI